MKTQMRNAVLAFFTLAAALAQAATTYHVDAARPDDSGDGLTPATAKQSIQAAIGLAADGDEITVADGTYAPITTGDRLITIRSLNGADVTFIDGGGAMRCATLSDETGTDLITTNTVLIGFTLKNGNVTSDYYPALGGGAYGGTLNDCALTNNSAICTFSGYADASGGGAYGATLNNCTLAGNTVSVPSSSSASFAIGGGASRSTLNNCALTGNTAAAAYGYAEGGGVCICTLNNCTLTGNTAVSYAVSSDFFDGAIGGGASSSTLNNCTLAGNTATAFFQASGGGACYGTLTDCTLTGNTAETEGGTASGGGAYLGTLTRCTLTGNTATNTYDRANLNISAYGGGACGGTLNDCTLANNTAVSASAAYGGGAASERLVPCTLNNCTLTGNTAITIASTSSASYYVQGGGAYDVRLNNCLLTGNAAIATVSAILAVSGGGAAGGTLNNCTVAGNTVSSASASDTPRGGGTSGGTLNNCIVWGNTAASSANCNSGTIAHSCTSPLPADGEGNTDGDPLFADAANGDFRLSPGSPCIDAGINTRAYGFADLDANLRVHNGTVDMGAYEYGAPPLSSAHIITFDARGGDVSPESKLVLPGDAYGELPAPTLWAHTFAGWFTEPDGAGTQAHESAVPVAAGDFTLYAHWTPNPTPTVTLDAQGGDVTPDSLTVTQGTTYGALPTPTRDGFAFTGWFTGPADGTRVTASTPVTEAAGHTLYARWMAVPPIGEALDCPGLTWTTGGDAPWFPQDTTAHDGDFAMQSGAITHNQNSWIETTVTGPGVLTFWWSASSENNYDWLTCTVNGAQDGRISGKRGWAQKSIQIPAGPVTVRWTYSKDDSSNDGSDCGWLDGAEWTPDADVTPSQPLRDPYLSETDSAGAVRLAVTTAYSGFLYDGGNALRGTVTLAAKAAVKIDKKAGTAATNWTFTAKAALLGGTVSFAGKASGAVSGFAVTAKGGETLDVTVEGGRFHGTLTGGKAGGTLHVDGARNAFADKKDAAAQTRLDAVRGYYTAALIGADGTGGYLTLTAGNAGGVKLAGKLADGTSVSGSAKLLDGLSDRGWLCVALHKPLYSKKGSVGGLLWLSPADKVLRVDTDYGWYIDWTRADASVRALDVCGGWYGTGVALKPSYRFSADVPADLPPAAANLTGGAWMADAFPRDMPVTAAGGKLTLPKADALKKPAKDAPQEYDYSGANPSGAKLTLAAKTGIFKGTFKLYYDGMGARGLQHKAVSVSCVGVLTPVRDAYYAASPVGLGTGTVKIGAQKVGVSIQLD